MMAASRAQYSISLGLFLGNALRRHVNLIGKFEFRQRSPIDIEAMVAHIDQEGVWQQLKAADTQSE
jgi:hypothetical protein